MIDSNIIEWLDFGDSTQRIDTYTKSSLKKIKRLFRTLVKNKNFVKIEIFFMIIFFIQLLSMSAIFILSDKELILEILNYIKNIILFFENITNLEVYKKYLFIFIIIIILDIILMLIILFTIKNIKLTIFISLINLLNIVIFYYLLGPVIQICLLSFWCENGQHKIYNIKCFSNLFHISFIIISIIIFLLYILISFIYSIYCNEIGTINNNLKEKIIRIHCNYESFCNIIKIIVNILYFILKIQNNNNNQILKLVYVGFITIICLIMTFYTYKYVYYYNNVVNFINYFGWSFSFYFSLCVFFKIFLNMNNISIFIITGWIVIIILQYRFNEMKKFLLITESNIQEFNSIKTIEMYKNILINLLSEKNKTNSRILLNGFIKSFEEYSHNNPEMQYHYQKLINDKNLIQKLDKEIDLPILSIIYILYSIHLEKNSNKLEIAFYMSYFLINKFKNATYAISLCSKIKATSHIGLYYKYLLSEDIKEYLSYKLKNSKKESLNHIQIGSVILYYLY